jgi:hypothetical protein
MAAKMAQHARPICRPLRAARVPIRDAHAAPVNDVLALVHRPHLVVWEVGPSPSRLLVAKRVSGPVWLYIVGGGGGGGRIPPRGTCKDPVLSHLVSPRLLCFFVWRVFGFLPPPPPRDGPPPTPAVDPAGRVSSGFSPRRVGQRGIRLLLFRFRVLSACSDTKLASSAFNIVTDAAA